MTHREFTDDEKALIAGGVLAAGAVIGTFIVLAAFGSYKKGQVITQNEVANNEPEPYDFRVFGDCQVEGCGNTNVELCEYRYHNDFNVPHCYDHSSKFCRGLCYKCWLWEDDD